MFWTLPDDGTLEIARKVSDDIFRILGKRPYLVAADFHRESLDGNRSAALAYQHPAAKPVYDFFQGKIRQYVDELRQRFADKTILVDIHGQGVDAHTVFRGTRNRQTVERLLNRVGEEGLTGPHSILGLLEQKGNNIFPLNSAPRTEEKSIFIGGYVVGTYGSHNAHGIDAIQLENGYYLRRRGQNRFSQDLAEALAGFYHVYLS